MEEAAGAVGAAEVVAAVIAVRAAVPAVARAVVSAAVSSRASLTASDNPSKRFSGKPLQRWKNICRGFFLCADLA